MRGPGWVTQVCWIGEATFPKLWHQIRPPQHTLCSSSSIMHVHILLLKITAFDLKHLSFSMMQQNIIKSHSFDLAVDYITNFLLFFLFLCSRSFIQFYPSKTQRGFQGIKESNVFRSNLFFPTNANNSSSPCHKFIWAICFFLHSLHLYLVIDCPLGYAEVWKYKC